MPIPSAVAEEPAAFDHSNSVQGAWKGAFDDEGRRQNLEFNIERATDGSWSGTWGVGILRVPFDQVTVGRGRLVAKSTLIPAVYEGVIDPEGKQFKGKWVSRGIARDLTMHRLLPGLYLPRPQDPVPPFPYAEREVSYIHRTCGIKLAGTLSVPSGAGPFPAILLITAAGAQDRDETLFGHKPFRLIADAFARKGFAVLRVDDRGVGGSGGSASESTSLDFATDVEAGLDFLKSQPEVDSKRIGLVGHGEGGLVASIVASERPEVAYIVLLAGPGIPGETIVHNRNDVAYHWANLSDAKIHEKHEFLGRLFAIAKSSLPKDEASRQASALYAPLLQPHDSQRATIEAEIEEMLSPWYRAFLTIDPAPYLSKVTCPILSLHGEKDREVLYEANQVAIAKAVKLGKNAPLTIRHFPDLDHLFQTADTGFWLEYDILDETFAPVALNALTDWVVQQAKR